MIKGTYEKNMYASITIFEIIIPQIFLLVKEKKKGNRLGFPFEKAGLLSAEGHAVGALVHGGIALVGAHQNLIQGAVVFALAVVCALMNGALHALVGMAIHCFPSFFMA